jgi:hypothetical protein
LTAAQRFDRLIEKQKENLFDLLSLDDFEDAFSVEKLSKEFFANYKEFMKILCSSLQVNGMQKKEVNMLNKLSANRIGN